MTVAVSVASKYIPGTIAAVINSDTPSTNQRIKKRITAFVKLEKNLMIRNILGPFVLLATAELCGQKALKNSASKKHINKRNLPTACKFAPWAG